MEGLFRLPLVALEPALPPHPRQGPQLPQRRQDSAPGMAAAVASGRVGVRPSRRCGPSGLRLPAPTLRPPTRGALSASCWSRCSQSEGVGAAG